MSNEHDFAAVTALLAVIADPAASQARLRLSKPPRPPLPRLTSGAWPRSPPPRASLPKPVQSWTPRRRGWPLDCSNAKRPSGSGTPKRSEFRRLLIAWNIREPVRSIPVGNGGMTMTAFTDAEPEPDPIFRRPCRPRNLRDRPECGRRADSPRWSCPLRQYLTTSSKLVGGLPRWRRSNWRSTVCLRASRDKSRAR